MRITYIGHSGFLAELPRCSLLFDCLAGNTPPAEETAFDIGRLPALNPSVPLLVFASHVHHDHYSPVIWDLRKKAASVTWLLSSDIPFTAGVQKRLGIGKEEASRVIRVRPGQEYHVVLPEAGDVRIRTLSSTDEGVAFLVQAEDRTLFHAGDLHLWLWEEEGADYMAEMQANFDAFTAPLGGLRVDAAFLPLDGRLEEHTFDGMDAYLAKMKVSHCFPMHLWKQYDLIAQYKKTREGRFPGCTIHEISCCGDAFDIS